MTYGSALGEFDAVAISSFSAQIKDAYRLADRYRAAGTVVIPKRLITRVRSDLQSSRPSAGRRAAQRSASRRAQQ